MSPVDSEILTEIRSLRSDLTIEIREIRHTVDGIEQNLHKRINPLESKVASVGAQVKVVVLVILLGIAAWFKTIFGGE